MTFLIVLFILFVIVSGLIFAYMIDELITGIRSDLAKGVYKGMFK